MRAIPYLIFLCLFTFALNAWADQLIIEPDMGCEPILNTIKNAEHSLELIMYGFTDEQLLNAFIQKKSQGKTVKIILEQHPYKNEDENSKVIAALKSHQIDWQGSIPPLRLIHQKTLIVDGRKALVMTFNFTKSSFKNQRNFALIIDNPQQVNQIESAFSADWNHVPTDIRSAELIYSPDSRPALLTLINSAKNSILIYAQTLSDYKIIGALAKAARKGVKIEFLTSAKIREQKANFLTRSGVHFRQSKHRYIHANVMIIDNQKALMGSINLTRSSLEDNRELAIITQDPTVIKQLTQTFHQDWNGAEGGIGEQMPKIHIDQRTILHFIHIIKKY